VAGTRSAARSPAARPSRKLALSGSSASRWAASRAGATEEQEAELVRLLCAEAEQGGDRRRHLLRPGSRAGPGCRELGAELGAVGAVGGGSTRRKSGPESPSIYG
jgi:hypothetical protein